MSRATSLFRSKPRTAGLVVACAVVLALVTSACAAKTTGVAVSEQALTTTTLPGLPEPGDGAELVDAAPDAEAAPAVDYGPWSTTEQLAGLGEGRGDFALQEVIELTIADVEAFWEREFEQQWDFGFVAVENKVAYNALETNYDELPECVQGVPREALVNAFYCVFDDAMAWDEGTLFPYLQESFGYLSPALVIAHEYGHAIQARLGTWLDSVAWRADVVLELQADCYEGAWLGDLVERGGGELGISAADVDRAFVSVGDLGDAPGARATDLSAHGTSFDRMSAFRQGFVGGIGPCVRYVEDLPTVTSAAFSEAEMKNLGNLPMGEVMPLVVADLERFWATEFEASFGSPYVAPAFIPIAPDSGSIAPCSGLEAAPAAMRGLATYCNEGHVLVDSETLLPSLESIGDLALAYPIVHAWGLQVLLQGVGEVPPAGPVLAGDCMSGVWLRGMWEMRGQLDLSAGDIDEAVRTFGVYTPTGPDGVPVASVPSLLDRVGAFSRGFLNGTDSCVV